MSPVFFLFLNSHSKLDCRAYCNMWLVVTKFAWICRYNQIELKYNIITDTHVLGESELSTLRGKQPIYVNAIERGIHAWLTKKRRLRCIYQFHSARSWNHVGWKGWIYWTNKISDKWFLVVSWKRLYVQHPLVAKEWEKNKSVIMKSTREELLKSIKSYTV